MTGSGNMTSPCYSNPSASSCAAFVRTDLGERSRLVPPLAVFACTMLGRRVYLPWHWPSMPSLLPPCRLVRRPGQAVPANAVHDLLLPVGAVRGEAGRRAGVAGRLSEARSPPRSCTSASAAKCRCAGGRDKYPHVSASVPCPPSIHHHCSLALPSTPRPGASPPRWWPTPARPMAWGGCAGRVWAGGVPPGVGSNCAACGSSDLLCRGAVDWRGAR